MGIIYLARDCYLQRDVALKLLNLSYVSDSTVRTRFFREAELAAGLNHPNIVPIYGFSENPPCIAMQHLTGGSLRDRLHRSGRLSQKETLEIAFQTASALAEAHRHGIIHRDIKPENILFDALDHVKVVDFGIARAKTDLHLTLTGQIIGTCQYMSPEQSSADADVTGPSSDVYSMGVMLYEMVTGYLPSTAKRQSAGKRPVAPVQCGARITGAFESIIMRCLKPDPGQRYEDASELLDVLNMQMQPSVRQPLHATVRNEKKKAGKRHTVRRIAITAGIVISGLFLFLWGNDALTLKNQHPSSKIHITLHSTPEGATLYLNGKPGGTTPYDGVIPPGDCHVALYREGYADTAFTISVPDPGNTITCKLQPLPRNRSSVISSSSVENTPARRIPVIQRSGQVHAADCIRIATVPSGARLTVADSLSAITPYTYGPALAGDVPMTIRLPGYRPLDTVIEYRTGRKNLLFYLVPDEKTAAGETGEGIDFTRTVLQHASSLRTLYEERIHEIPDMKGKVTVEFTINGGGEVEKCSIVKSTIDDAVFLGSVTDNCRTWNFGKTGRKQPAAITYTFPFEP